MISFWHLLPKANKKIVNPLLVCRFRWTCKYLQSFSAMKLSNDKNAHVLLISTWMDIWFCLKVIFNLTLKNWLLIFSQKN